MNGAESTTNNIQAIQEQLETLAIFLERPAVQRQVLAIIAVVMLALFIGWVLDKLLDRLVRNIDEDNIWRNKVLPAVGITFFPLVGLALIYGVLQVFTANGYLTGLIGRFIQLFWVLLVYYAAVFVLYITLGEKVMRPYLRRILSPTLIIVIALLIASESSTCNLSAKSPSSPRAG